MNIFVLDLDPKLAAQYHCDKHVVKMILETAQLLCTAHHVDPNDDSILRHLYKPTHINHPCAIWVRESIGNYLWACALLQELLNEYTLRFYKRHKVLWSDLFDMLARALPAIPSLGRTDFALAMPDEYKITGQAVQSYRQYYIQEKAHLLAYRRGAPSWIKSVF